MAPRRAISERLAAAEGQIASLEALVASQQQTIELLGEAAQAWLASGEVFQKIAAEFHANGQRLAALEVAVKEIRAARAAGVS